MYSDPIDDHLGLPYDLRSIMHYKSTAFSKNGKDTIVPKDPNMPASALGQREKPSEIDILKVHSTLCLNHKSVSLVQSVRNSISILLDSTSLQLYRAQRSFRIQETAQNTRRCGSRKSYALINFRSFSFFFVQI